MPLTDSILDSVKKMLGITETDIGFDTDIITNINSAFMFLNQMGIGPSTPFSIEDNTSTWNDFSPDIALYQSAKPFVYLQTRLTFDPPGTSFTQQAYKDQAQEIAWRLITQYDLANYPPPESPEEP